MFAYCERSGGDGQAGLARSTPVCSSRLVYHIWNRVCIICQYYPFNLIVLRNCMIISFVCAPLCHPVLCLASIYSESFEINNVRIFMCFYEED